MSRQPRYAIYFVPMRHTSIYQFGASVLGYDCYSGSDTKLLPAVDVADWQTLVAQARAYGFHGTLKAPFYLADGFAEADLFTAADRFARAQVAVWVGDLVVRDLDGFLALTPKTRSEDLDALADRCVRFFDPLRAPLTDADRERRQPAKLSPRQRSNLERWGYPYIFDDFRFHMTLTGPLRPDERARWLPVLSEQFARIPSVLRTLTVSQIVMARQVDNGSPFSVVHTAVLGNSLFQPYAHAF